MVIADGPKIARLRKAAGLTRKRLCQQVVEYGHGSDVLTETSLYRIETERQKNVLISTLGAIADVLDEAMDELTKRDIVAA